MFIPLATNYLIVQLIFILLLKIFKKEYNLFVFKKNWYLLLFFFYVFISSILFAKSNIDVIYIEGRLQMILLLLLFILLLQASKFRYTIFFENTILFGFFCSSIYIVLLNSIGISFSEREIFEEGSGQVLAYQDMFPDRNYASSLFSFGIAITFYRLVSSPKKTLHILLLILFFGTQIVLNSRGGILTSVILLIFILIIVRKKIYQKINYLLILFFLFLIVLFSFDTSSLEKRFLSDDLSSQSGRKEIRDDTLELFFNQNLSDISFGGGTFHGVTNLANGTSIHNNFLEVLYDYGVIGLVIFVSLITYLFRKSKFNKVIIMVYLLISLSLSPIMNSTFWLFLIFLLFPNQLENEYSTKEI
jgi:hypothetical protein